VKQRYKLRPPKRKHSDLEDHRETFKKLKIEFDFPLPKEIFEEILD